MLSFANTPGALFNRLGKLGGLVQSLYAYQQTQLSNMINIPNGVTAQFNSEPDIQAMMGSNYIAQLSSPEGIASLAQQIAAITVSRMVYRDDPQYNQTLTQQNVLASIQEVIRQMNLAGATILQMTITATATQFNQFATNTGNGVIVASTKRPSDGLNLENSFTETLLFECTQDSYTGGATVGNEQITVTGAGAETDIFAFDWPLGSNANTSMNCIDGDVSNGSNNLLNNSGFASWVNIPNVPDFWNLIVGVAGTNIQQNNTIIYTTGSSLQIIGDGTTLTSLEQPFNSATGTSTVLSPFTQYSHNLFIRRDGVSPAAGVLQVDLCDVNGVVLLDAVGNANSYQVNLTTLTTQFANYGGSFRTPEILPSQLFIRYHLTTALTNGRSIYLDKTGLGFSNNLYANGPFAAMFSGSVPFIQGDFAELAINNSRGAGGTLSTWQTLLYQLLPIGPQNGIQWPSSLSPTISDTLIQG